MTRTSSMFGGLAFAVLTVFALWTSTLGMPQGAVSAPAPTASAARLVA